MIVNGKATGNLPRVFKQKSDIIEVIYEVTQLQIKK